MLWIFLQQINNFFTHIKNAFKYTRGVRILKCRVDENGRKIVVFQALGSFHSEEIEYSEYKNGLIYDTEPSDVELVSIFFHCSHFEKYNIYCFDPIHGVISICDAFQKHVVHITSENWAESIKYIKYMNNSEFQHVINAIVNFELNNYIKDQNEFDLENANVIRINNYEGNTKTIF